MRNLRFSGAFTAMRLSPFQNQSRRARRVWQQSILEKGGREVATCRRRENYVCRRMERKCPNSGEFGYWLSGAAAQTAALGFQDHAPTFICGPLKNGLIECG